jgi:hypothetical protein
MEDPLFETIFKIKQSRQELADACLSGVDNWETYLRIVGRAQGLQEALDIINIVLKEDEEDIQ